MLEEKLNYLIESSGFVSTEFWFEDIGYEYACDKDDIKRLINAVLKLSMKILEDNDNDEVRLWILKYREHVRRLELDAS